ncbi:cation diffusion facilitator family transporter [Pelotomaculum terephthalicicum JT]|uniref:Cation diffusion facilitator family transporter n=1 Tax=Pelotomaculum isophthalicicum JI TaxID=947010 RepID=A0A9X4H796_9FIRM|nr:MULTISPECIES: cation diffusion facilitator family transporter [Pelotomaculum]MCG9967061.1 cation diffusion facilitator family transporter [Pelotomaculum terephthalicicum JT]MDF9409269.1 cation diffusion facilitator family transporter [Pelotomaculum isophthalicicum JI]OPX87382.1 MAG: ferrous iron efflux protein F [Pelotomaculum sp. PtaB.Bin013]OPY63893.1 MAG: ferrous iron efflux protein F [Pelotomaculum sp. PtaU1.Bin065]
MHSTGYKALWIALFANLSVFLTKAIAAWVGNSAAMFSEALHSLSDLVNSIFLLVGMKLASRPADMEHPFGYGKEVYFWSFIASVFMFGVTSMGSITRGYHQIIDPHPIEAVELLVIALSLAALFEMYAVRAAMSAVLNDVGVQARGFKAIAASFKNINNVANPAVKFVFYEDFAALVGVVIALIAVAISKVTNNIVYDGAASIIIGIILGVMGVMLAYENRDMIIGRAAHPNIVRRIGDIAMRVPGVTDVQEIKTMYIGAHSLLVNMTIETKPKLSIEYADDIVAEVEKRIVKRLNIVKEINIEVVADDKISDWQKKRTELNELDKH